MVKKELEQGLYVRHIQSGRIFGSIADCEDHMSIPNIIIRQILNGNKRSYKGLSFECIDEYGNVVPARWRMISKYDRIAEDDREEDPAFVEERNRIYFSPFVCCETGEEFESVIDCHDKTGIRVGIIVDCLTSGISYKGRSFKYI